MGDVEVGTNNYDGSCWSRFIGCFRNVPVYTKITAAAFTLLFVLGVNQMFALWMCILLKGGGPSVALFLMNMVGILTAVYLLYTSQKNEWIIK